MYDNLFFQTFIYLLATVISVPVAKRMGLGSVLGYLMAGIIIGPFVLKLVGKEGQDVMHFAEFGVVIMLFLIGLELKPREIWKMRHAILGLGGMQVSITATVIGIISLLIGFNASQSITIGLILALSSTAIVLQALSEKGIIRLPAGQKSFAVLLFQDIAVIPIIAILPLLATNIETAAIEQHDNILHDLSAGQQVITIIGVITSFIFIGRFLSRHVFRIIANAGSREVFTAVTLLIVVGIAIAMNKIGLSPALGSFVAGVVLADNEYRHELESNLEPFKGLLLGVFFIAIGAGINFTVFFNQTALILEFLALLITIKFAILFILGKFFKLKLGQGLWFSFALAQAGEFGFVIAAFASKLAILNSFQSEIIVIIIALSMAFTPILLLINEKIVQKFIRKRSNREADEIELNESKVIIAGFGRFGLVVGRLLLANGINVTILDSNPSNIEVLRKFGFKVYYGDASRLDLLISAGIETAQVLIVAIDDKKKSIEIAEQVSKNFAQVKILARAYDTDHAFEFFRKGINKVKRESFNSALDLGSIALTELGFDRYHAYRIARSFKYHDEKVLEKLYSHWLEDKNDYIRETKNFAKQLEIILKTEKNNTFDNIENAWDIQPEKKKY